MSVKMRAILVFSLVILHSSMIKAQVNWIDCLGYNFFCSTANEFLPCTNDEDRKTTGTLADGRSLPCPAGTFCDTSNEHACDADCGGKDFFCSTNRSYIQCDLKSDGTYRTKFLDLQPCPDEKYCHNIYSTAACDLSAIPEPAPPITTNETPSESTEPSAVTEPAPITSAPALGELPGYTCAGTGRYPHPTDCRSYIVCSVSGSTYRNSQHRCANELVYHVDYSGCRPDTSPCDNMEFKCVETGRFANPLDPSKYYWCLKVNGAFMTLKYSCPAGKIYDGKNACIEPMAINSIETWAINESLNVYSTSRRSLSVQENDVADEERYLESDEMVADRISLNSNEDASVYARDDKYSRL